MTEAHHFKNCPIASSTRGDQKVLQLDILDWKTFQILHTSKKFISPLLIMSLKRM